MQQDNEERILKALEGVLDRMSHMEVKLSQIVRLEERVNNHTEVLSRYGNRLDSHDNRIRGTELWQANYGEKASLEQKFTDVKEDVNIVIKKFQELERQWDAQRGQKSVAYAVLKWVAGILAALLIFVLTEREASAMSITAEDLRARFPEFAEETVYPEPRLNMMIEDTQLIYMGTDEKRWAGRYNYAQAYLAAHLLTVAENTEAGDSNAKVGPVSSKSAGGVSVTRAVSQKQRSDTDEFYMQTAYGQTYIQVRNRTFVGVLTANSL